MDKADVTIPRKLFDFLMGTGEFDGKHFGDLDDNLPGRFWWRALLMTCDAPIDEAEINKMFGWSDIQRNRRCVESGRVSFNGD